MEQNGPVFHEGDLVLGKVLTGEDADGHFREKTAESGQPLDLGTRAVYFLGDVHVGGRIIRGNKVVVGDEEFTDEPPTPPRTIKATAERLDQTEQPAIMPPEESV